MSGSADTDIIVEVRRIGRIADMLCTAHAGLRDRYARRSKLLDFSIFLISAWLLALAFIDPQINAALTPPFANPKIWAGLLAFSVFVLSFVQLLVDWKGRASGHAVALSSYSSIKREIADILASGNELDERSYNSLVARCQAAGSVQIPEKEFLRQKKRHLIKLEVSKHLDSHPGSWLWAKRVGIFWRDNFKRRI